MSLLLVVVNLVVSVLIGWFYLGWFYDYAQGTIYASYFLATAIVCGILMFLWIPEIGEDNRLMVFGFNTGITVKPGTYILANIAPFFREINLHLGFSITRLQDGRKINNENVNMKIYKDQRRTEYSARVTTTSFFALNFDKFLHNLVAFLLDFKGEHDQVQYYKVGRTLFLVLLLVTAIARITHPSGVRAISPSKPSVTSSQQSSPPLVFGATPTVDVFLQKRGPVPIPELKNFKLGNDGIEGGHYFFGEDGKKYLTFSEPSSNQVRGIHIRESVCVLIPWGRQVVFLTKYPPHYAANVINPVSYYKKESSYNLFERSVVAFRKSVMGKDTAVEETVSWENLYKNWSEVNGESLPGLKVEARYQKNNEDPRVGGALVCF